MKPLRAAVLAGSLIGLASCEPPALEHQVPAGAVRLGDLLWSASDLRVVRYRNGDSIPQAVSREDLLRFGEEGVGAWMADADGPDGAPTIFYNWYAATDPRGLGTDGWRLPTDEEWTAMVETLGADSAGIALMSEGRAPDLPGANRTGFDAAPHGYRGWDSIEGRGRYASWWTGTEVEADTYYAIFRGVGTDYPGVHRGQSSKYWGMSVRLVAEPADSVP